MKEIRIKTEDGIEIAFNESYTGRDKVIIVCHGIRQNKDAPIFTKIAMGFEKDYDVINMDLRGHGESGGGCTLTALEVYDLKAVVDYARQNHHKVGVIGFSLAAATAVLETADYHNIDSLILVSPFTKITDVNLRFWRRSAISCIIEDIRDSNQKVKMGNIFLDKQNPIDLIDRLSPTPVLFLHGREDWVIDASQSQRLYERASEPKELIIFEDAGHAERLYQRFPERFEEICLRWFKETL